MKKLLMFAVLMLLPLIAVEAADKSPQQVKSQIQQNSAQILEQLYGISPSARKQIAAAYGYATFSTFGMKLMVAGGGNGKGMAVRNKPRQQIFMKMASVQAGLGFGIKKASLVFVFKDKAAFDQFVDSGWEVGGQASLAATTGNEGLAIDGAVSVAPGVWLYQMTDQGLVAELAVKGTKFYRDSDLN